MSFWQIDNHCPSHSIEHFITLKAPWAPLQSILFSSLCPLAAAYLLSTTIVLLFLEFHIHGIIQYIVFCDWLFSHTAFVINLLLHVSIHSFSWIIFYYTDIPQFVYSFTHLMDIWAVCTLFIVGSAAMNMRVQIFVWTFVFISLR